MYPTDALIREEYVVPYPFRPPWHRPDLRAPMRTMGALFLGPSLGLDLRVARRYPEDNRRAWPWGPWGRPLSHSRAKLSLPLILCMCESGVGVCSSGTANARKKDAGWCKSGRPVTEEEPPSSPLWTTPERLICPPLAILWRPADIRELDFRSRGRVQMLLGPDRSLCPVLQPHLPQDSLDMNFDRRIS